MKNVPTVSVISATWQRHDLLARAIKSLQAQTFTDWEHIIVSDGPDDGLEEVAARLNHTCKIIRCGRNWFPNTGPKTAGSVPRATGCYLASGNYIAYLDDDNEYLPRHLEKLTAKIKEGYGFVYSNMNVLKANGEFIKVIGSGRPHFGAIDTNLIMHQWQTILCANWSIDPPPKSADDFQLVSKWMANNITYAWVNEQTVNYYMRS